MAIIERGIQKIACGKWADSEEIGKRFDAVEMRAGFPPKKRYRALIGGHVWDTLIVERGWESMAAMEGAYEKVMADPQWQALMAEGSSIVESIQIELYMPLE